MGSIMAPDASKTIAQPVLRVTNTSQMGRMLWIGFYTLLLNIVTLTLFRFWGRTHFLQAAMV